MVASMLVTEMSSPLLHLREMLKELGVRDTELNLLVDVLFAATFSAARMGVGPYLTYVTVTADNPILIKVYLLTTPFRSPTKLTTMTTSTRLVSSFRFALHCPQAMATGLQLVSAYWFLRILRMVRYKLAVAGKKKPLPPPTTPPKLAAANNN